MASVALGADPTSIDTWYLSAVDGLMESVLFGHGRARRMSTDYLRQHSMLEGHPVTPVPASLDVNRARTALRVTGPVAFKTAVAAGQDEAQAIRTMSTRMSGAASRLTLAGDRDTLSDTMFAREGIVGYRRVLGGPGCGFCAMLASRGAVYLTERTASRDSTGERYHDHCRCSPEPLYEHEEEPDAVKALQREWRRVTSGESGNAAVKAWRRSWEGRTPARRQSQFELAAAEPAAGLGRAGRAIPDTVTIRPALESARTPFAVEQAFRREYRRITGRLFTPGGLDFQGSAASWREQAEGILRGLEAFPDVRLTVVDTSISPNVNTYAEAGGGAISFNYRWTSPAARNEYVQSVANDVAEGFHPLGTGSPMGLAVHEFGHLLDLGTLGKAIHPDVEALLIRRAAERDAMLAARRAAGEPIEPEDFVAGDGVDGLIRREVSEYATKNRNELVAEAFSDAIVNGPNASQLSREIFDLLEADYRKRRLRTGVSLGKSASVPAPDLAKMTVAELKALAKTRGIKGYTKMRKAELVDALKPIKAAKKAAKKAAPPPAPTSAKTVLAGDFGRLVKVGPQAGSTPGARYRADDGTEWYIKQLADTEHVQNEVLAASLYRSAGIDVPDVVAGKGAPGLTGDHLIASRIDPGSGGPISPTDSLMVAKVREGFAVDAWLANWDVAGASFDNIIKVGSSVRRIDVGGSLLFRAQGAPKGTLFGDTVPEWKTLRDSGRSPQASQFFAGMTTAELRTAVSRVKAVTPAKIRSLVRQGGMPPDLADKLIARRADVIAQLKAELAVPRVSPAVVKARTKFDSQLATAKVNQAGLDQAPLKLFGSGHGSTVDGFDRAFPNVHTRREIIGALENYRGDSDDINRFLRGGRVSNPSIIQRSVDRIRKAHAKSKLRESVVVWRGVREGDSVFGPQANWPSDLSGAEWTDPAFFSTSVSLRKAEEFAGRVLMRFILPKGTPVVHISGYEYEAELMIRDGYRFRVIRDHGRSGTIDRVLDVEVIPPRAARRVP